MLLGGWQEVDYLNIPLPKGDGILKRYHLGGVILREGGLIKINITEGHVPKLTQWNSLFKFLLFLLL